MIGFAKRGLPHTSSSQYSMIHNFERVKATDLHFAQFKPSTYVSSYVIITIVVWIFLQSAASAVRINYAVYHAKTTGAIHLQCSMIRECNVIIITKLL